MSTVRSFGPHKVRHGDVMTGIENLMGNDRARIMYSDPPWGGGNLKYWATMNEKMTGAVVQAAELDPFLDMIFGIASRYVDGFLLVEYGVRWRAMIQERGIGAGFQAKGIVGLRYGSAGKLLPLDLHLFARPGLSFPEGYGAAVADSYGYDTLKRAIPPLAAAVGRGAIILDPCCGMGYTAQAAIDYGLTFRGNELNAKRLGKTVARLEKCL